MAILGQYLYGLIIVILSSDCMYTSNGFILPSEQDFINGHKMTWDEAEHHCSSTYNTHLISIHDSFTFSQIRAEIPINRKAESFWIGLQNTNINPTTNGGLPDYKWSDLSAFDFGHDIDGQFPWFDERPEKPEINTKVRLWGGGGEFLWDDQDGNNLYFWICNSNPYKTDINDINDNKNTNHSRTPSSFVSSPMNTNLPSSAASTTNDPYGTSSSKANSESMSTAEYDDNSEYFGGDSSSSSKSSVTFFDMNIYWKIGIVSILCLSCFIVLCLFHLYQIKNLEVGVWKKKVAEKNKRKRSRARSRGRSRESVTATSKSVIGDESDAELAAVSPRESSKNKNKRRENPSKSKSKTNTNTNTTTKSSGAQRHNSSQHSVFSPSSPSPSPSMNVNNLPNMHSRHDTNKHKRNQIPVLKFTASNTHNMLSPPPTLRHPVHHRVVTHHLYDDVEDQVEPSMTETYHDGGRYAANKQPQKTPPPSKMHSAQNSQYTNYTSLVPVISRYNLSRDVTVSYDDRVNANAHHHNHHDINDDNIHDNTNNINESEIDHRFRSHTYIDDTLNTEINLKSEGNRDETTNDASVEVLGAVHVDSPTTDVFFVGKATPKYLMDQMSNVTRTTVNTEDEEKVSLTHTDDMMEFNGDLYKKFNKVIVNSDGNRRRHNNKSKNVSKHIRKGRKHKLNESAINELIFEVHGDSNNHFNPDSETSVDGTIITMDETTDDDDEDGDEDGSVYDEATHDESQLVQMMIMRNNKSNNTSVLD